MIYWTKGLILYFMIPLFFDFDLELLKSNNDLLFIFDFFTKIMMVGVAIFVVYNLNLDFLIKDKHK